MPNGISHLIDWNSRFLFKGVLGGIFHFYSRFYRKLCKQTVETLTRQLHSVASDLSLHYLPMSHKKDASHIWVKECNYFAYLIRNAEIWEVYC